MSNLTDPRVLFAAERTLLAWNRTSLGMMAFGFILERAGLLLSLIQGQAENDGGVTPVFLLAITFIILGGLCAGVSSYQFAMVLKTLTPEEIPTGYNTRWGMAVNIVVAMLSVALTIILYSMRA